MPTPTQLEPIEIMPLMYYGNPILSKKSALITTIDDNIKRLAGLMIATMNHHDGIGLAASQVGYNINLIALDVPRHRDQDQDTRTFTTPGEEILLPQMPLILVNTRLHDFSENLTEYVEGCLSIPGIKSEVLRPEFVTVDAQLLDGSTISLNCGGLLSRCLQHEYDHINGILFLNLLAPEVLKKLNRDLNKLKKTLKSQS